MLDAVESTSTNTMHTIAAIKDALQDYKHRTRAAHRFYSQDLINNLFTHPCTKIGFVQQGLGVSRPTATKYLDTLAGDGFLRKLKFGRTNDHMNEALRNTLVVPSEGFQ